MRTPKIDERDYVAILKEIDERAGKYIPELKARKDAGFALMQIYARMHEHVIDQLNRVPDKHFTAFLNMLGTKLLPAQPARAPVTFALSVGAAEDVLIPAGTQAQTSATEAHPALSFETEKTMTATVSKLKAVYSVNPFEDKIYEHTPDLLQDSKAVTLFNGSSLQQHAFYFGHEFLFNLGNPIRRDEDDSDKYYSSIELRFEPTDWNFFKDNKIVWEYWGQNLSTNNEEWIAFDTPPLNEHSGPSDPFVVHLNQISESGAAEPIVPNPKILDPSYQKIVAELQSRGETRQLCWIRGRLAAEATTPMDTYVKFLSAGSDSSVHPDLAFYNDVQIDFNKNEFLPFGAQPNTNDSFYIASQEIFSKPDTPFDLEFELTPGTLTSTGLVLWEYWDGKTWNTLGSDYGFDNDEETNSAETKTLRLTCPPDIAPVEVNGKKNYWIRARIISGNYGLYIPPEISSEQIPSAPHITNVKIQQQVTYQKVAYCFSENCLQLEQWNLEEPFQPFKVVTGLNQAMYLGFDRLFANGRISLFFSLLKQECLEEKKPQVTWNYLKLDASKAETWVPLPVFDTTDNLTESGTVSLIGPSELSKAKKFGQELFWIRAEFASTNEQLKARFETLTPISLFPLHYFTYMLKNLVLVNYPLPPASYWTRPIINVSKPPTYLQIGPCVPQPFFHPTFNTPQTVKETPPAPMILGICLNTTWAAQAETVTDEMLGASNGKPNQTYVLSRTPIVSETIWVNEQTSPAESLVTTNENVTVAETGEVWVKWSAFEDFFTSDENCRHYTIDRTFGTIKFGNGINGKIPPITGTIKATYQTGGGTAGNVASGEIKNLATSIAFVDKVVNPDSAQGGADTETERRAKEKAPKRLQHRYRAVAQEDYEWIAKEASRAVARAKCLPNFSSSGEEQLGCVALIIVPESREDQPEPSPELLRIVETYVREHMPVNIKTLTVASPDYLKLNVKADLYIKSIDASTATKFAASAKLTSYFHPLYGGDEGEGWDFGKVPCISDVIGILQKVPGVDHVENLHFTLTEENTQRDFEVTAEIALPPYTLICSGTHSFEAKLSGGN